MECLGYIILRVDGSRNLSNGCDLNQLLYRDFSCLIYEWLMVLSFLELFAQVYSSGKYGYVTVIFHCLSEAKLEPTFSGKKKKIDVLAFLGVLL